MTSDAKPGLVGDESKSLWRRWLGKLIPLLVVVAAAGGVMAAATWIKERSRAAPPSAVAPINVQVAIVTAEDVPDEFELPGLVEPNRTVTVSAEVAGRIESICCEKGSLVKQGQALVHINTELLQADYDRAKADEGFAQTQHDRTLDLRKTNAVTEKEVDDTRTRLDMAKAALASAKAKLDRTVIYAPIDGVLDQRPVEVGMYVIPGTLTCTIVDVATVKVAVDVPEQDISYLRPGQEETITLRAGHVESDAGQTEVVGKISYVTKQSNPSSHTMRVEILVENPCDELRTGQFVNVRLRRQVIRDAIMIPLAAVIPTEGQRVVYVAEGDTARQRNVEIGIIRGTRVQVLRSPVGVGKGAATLPAGRSPTTAPAGLAVGDKLILPPGNRYVGPGQKIAVPTGAEK